MIGFFILSLYINDINTRPFRLRTKQQNNVKEDQDTYFWDRSLKTTNPTEYQRGLCRYGAPKRRNVELFAH